MKTTLTFAFFLLTCVGAQAQVNPLEVTEASVKSTSEQVVTQKKDREQDSLKMVRIYKYRISRIKKALSFTARKDRAKVV